jgi:hypothetical protein
LKTLDEFLSDSPDAVGGGLEVLRLAETPVLVALFTREVDEVDSHFLDYPNLRGEVQCNTTLEGRCLLCDLKKKPAKKGLLPVYDVASATVKVLSISEARDPHSLGPQIKAEVRKGNLNNRYLAISRVYNKYEVRSIPAGEGQDMGEAAIAGFLRKLKEELISLKRSISVYANAELWDVPELERTAKALGLASANYVRGGTTPGAAER